MGRAGSSRPSRAQATPAGLRSRGSSPPLGLFSARGALLRRWGSSPPLGLFSARGALFRRWGSSPLEGLFSAVGALPRGGRAQLRSQPGELLLKLSVVCGCSCCGCSGRDPPSHRLRRAAAATGGTHEIHLIPDPVIAMHSVTHNALARPPPPATARHPTAARRLTCSSPSSPP